MEIFGMAEEVAEQVRRERKAVRALVSVFVVVASITLGAQKSAAQWATVGGDSGNTRYSSLSQSNAQNVTKLGAAWVSEKVGPAPTARSMPVIDNGLIFLTAPPYVYAVNLSTGKVAWRYNALPGGTPALEGVPVNNEE
jgi:glucose dehydrogenase